MTVTGTKLADDVNLFEFHVTNQDDYHYDLVHDHEIKELIDELRDTGLTIEGIMIEIKYATWTGRIKCVGLCKANNKPFHAQTYGEKNKRIRKDHVVRHIMRNHKPEGYRPPSPKANIDDGYDYEPVTDPKIKKMLNAYKESGHTIEDIKRQMKNGIWTGFVKCVGRCKRNNKPAHAKSKSRTTIKTCHVIQHIKVNHKPDGLSSSFNKRNIKPKPDKVVNTEIGRQDDPTADVLPNCDGSPNEEVTKVESEENLDHSSDMIHTFSSKKCVPLRIPPKTEPGCDLLMDNEVHLVESTSRTKYETVDTFQPSHSLPETQVLEDYVVDGSNKLHHPLEVPVKIYENRNLGFPLCRKYVPILPLQCELPDDSPDHTSKIYTDSNPGLYWISSGRKNSESLHFHLQFGEYKRYIMRIGQSSITAAGHIILRCSILKCRSTVKMAILQPSLITQFDRISAGKTRKSHKLDFDHPEVRQLRHYKVVSVTKPHNCPNIHSTSSDEVGETRGSIAGASVLAKEKAQIKLVTSGCVNVDEEADNDFVVQDILESRNVNGEETEFLIHWRGFPKDEATWEPEANLDHCSNVIQTFLKLQCEPVRNPSSN